MQDVRFPTGGLPLVLILQNWVVNFPTYMVTLGLTQDDIDRVTAYAANFEYMLSFSNRLKDNRNAYTEFKRDMMYGDPSKTPDAPSFESVTLPEAGNGGLLPWCRQTVRRIKASPNYTAQIGEVLGLITFGPGEEDLADFVPSLKPKAGLASTVSASFVKKGFDGAQLYWRVAGEETWQGGERFMRSPAVINVSSEDGKPVKIELRARMIKGDTPVTNYSPSYYVVTNP